MEHHPVHNKTEIVAAIAEKTGLTKVDTEAAMTAFQDFLVDAVGRGETVKLTGLFALERVRRAARVGRNPRTGEQLDIPESWGVKLTAGSLLKNAVK